MGECGGRHQRPAPSNSSSVRVPPGVPPDEIEDARRQAMAVRRTPYGNGFAGQASGIGNVLLTESSGERGVTQAFMGKCGGNRSHPLRLARGPAFFDTTPRPMSLRLKKIYSTPWMICVGIRHTRNVGANRALRPQVPTSSCVSATPFTTNRLGFLEFSVTPFHAMVCHTPSQPGHHLGDVKRLDGCRGPTGRSSSMRRRSISASCLLRPPRAWGVRWFWSQSSRVVSPNAASIRRSNSSRMPRFALTSSMQSCQASKVDIAELHCTAVPLTQRCLKRRLESGSCNAAGAWVHRLRLALRRRRPNGWSPRRRASPPCVQGARCLRAASASRRPS